MDKNKLKLASRKLSIAKSVLNNYQTELLENRFAPMIIRAGNMGSCYERAVSRHKTVLRHQQQLSQLNDDMLFGVLEMICCGGLSAISSWAKARKLGLRTKTFETPLERLKSDNYKRYTTFKKQMTNIQRAQAAFNDKKKIALVAKSKKTREGAYDLFAEGIEDCLQSALDNLFGSDDFRNFGKKLIGSPPKDRIPVSIGPVQFKTDITNALTKQKSRVATCLRQIRSHLIEMEKSLMRAEQGVALSSKDTINIKYLANIDVNRYEQVLKADMARRKATVEVPPTINQPKMEKELEIGIWALWVMKNCRRVQRNATFAHLGSMRRNRVTGPATVHVTKSLVDPGSAVEVRLTELGIAKAAGISSKGDCITVKNNDFGWWTEDAEVKKLISWAKTWKPKQRFGGLNTLRR